MCVGKFSRSYREGTSISFTVLTGTGTKKNTPSEAFSRAQSDQTRFYGDARYDRGAHILPRSFWGFLFLFLFFFGGGSLKPLSENLIWWIERNEIAAHRSGTKKPKASS